MIRSGTVDDIEALARVHVDAARTVYRGILPDAHLAKLSYERRAELWRQHLTRPHSMFVALDGARLVGFADGGPTRTLTMPFDGELYAIYLDFAVHRRGIGRALVSTLARALSVAGHQSLLVRVLRDNPACRFYERLGGVPVGEQEVLIGGATLIEIAYGWRSLDPLL
jgi:GNAT superfamily N-acetyltransferase